MRFNKLLLAGIGFLLAQLCAVVPAHAVACSGTSVHGSGNHTCYAIAAGAWGATTVWSATSGGASCGCTITTGDELIFDANTPAGTYTNINITLASLDATAAPAGVILSGNNAVNISGLFYGLSAAMTYTASTAAINFTSTTGTTLLKSGGQSLPPLVFNGSGGTFRLGGDASNTITTAAANSITLTAGTLDASTNNPNVNANAFSGAAGTLNCGTGTWTWTTTTGAAFTFSGTISCASAAFTFTQTTPIGVRSFATAGSTYGAITINGPASNANDFAFQITGSGTFASLTVNSPLQLSFSSGTTTTVTATPQFVGTAANPISVVGGATQSTMAVAAGTAPAWQWAFVNNMTITGNTSGTCTNCFNGGHNIGITLTGPSGGHIIGG